MKQHTRNSVDHKTAGEVHSDDGPTTPDEGKDIRLERKLRGEHCVNIFISYELKERLQHLAQKYDRTVADMVRAVLRVGIPMMEGLSEAEEIMVREYVQLFRRLRQVKSLKEV